MPRIDAHPRHEPQFSVILTTYSRPTWLAEAIASVMVQTVVDFELIVVDDGSTPPAAVPEDGRIRLVALTENRGLSAARNVGWDHARGRSVAFLDDDDCFTPNRLELAAQGLERAPIATCWFRFLGGRERPGRVLDGYVGDTVLDALTPSIGATAMRRDLPVRFDERWDGVEDIDWWLRATREHPVSTVKEVGYLIRRHDTPRWRNDRRVRALENMALIDEYSEYFRAHPKAEAFRLRRAGLLALQSGDRELARAALARSLRLRPGPKTLWHLGRSVPGASLRRQTRCTET